MALSLRQRKVLGEYLRRKGHQQLSELPFWESLLPQQRELILAKESIVGVLCGRRSGKSAAVSFKLYVTMAHTARSLSLYVAKTRDQARQIVWRALKEMAVTYKLPLEFDEQKLIVTHTVSGSQTIFVGCDKIDELEKRRGLKLTFVAIDEAASLWKYLDVLTEEILEPALMDTKGQLWLVGSPGVVRQGKFYLLTRRFSYPVSGGEDLPGTYVAHWDVLENTFIPHAAEWLKKKREEKNWREDNPIYVREYRGLWVNDTSNLVYPYSADNIISSLPAVGQPWRHVVGVDLGYRDDTAIVVGAFTIARPELFIVEAKKKPGMTVTDILEALDEVYKNYNVEVCVWDTGGSGSRNIVEEIRKRRGYNIQAAEKMKKREYQELLADDLRTNKLKILAGSPILTEWDNLVWDEEGLKEHESCPNHLSDAALYMWRRAYNYIHRPEGPPKPKKGTPEWYDAEEERMFFELQEARRTNLERLAKKAEEIQTDWGVLEVD